MLFKMFFKKKTLYEINSTVWLFITGLFLGALIFWNKKALLVLGIYIVFLISTIIHDLIQIYFANHFGLSLKKYIIYTFGTKKMYGKDFENSWIELLYSFIGLVTYVFLFLLSFFIAKLLLPSLWPQTISLQNTITAQTFDMVMYNYPLFGIFWVNFLLFAFNLLILAAPLDGGKFLKSILAIVFSKRTANKLMPIISKVIGVLIIGLGIVFWDILIVLLGIFVYYISTKNEKENEITFALNNKKVEKFIKPAELVFEANISVFDAFKEMKTRLIPEAIVKFGKKEYGVIDADKISNISKINWPTTKVNAVAIKVDPTNKSESLSYIALYMVEKDLPILPVIDRQDNLLGVIKRSDLADFLKLHKFF